MVAIRFEGEKKQALMGAQSFLMDFKQALGLDIKNDQIGNYATGEPDGVYGKGTRSAFSQLVRLAQKKAGVDTSDDSLSPANLKHVEAYLKMIPSTRDNDARISKFLTDIATVNETDGKTPSLLASAHDRVGKDSSSKIWHIDTTALTLPTFGKRYTAAKPEAPRESGELTKVHAAAVSGTPTATPAVYRPDAAKPDTGLTTVKVTFEEYQTIQLKSEITRDLKEQAILKAFDKAYGAALDTLGHSAKQQRLGVLREAASNNTSPEFLALRAKIDQETQGLVQLDTKLRDKQVPIIINGRDMGTRSQNQVDDINFGFRMIDNSLEKAMREEMAKQFKLLQDKEGYTARFSALQDLNKQSNESGKNAGVEMRRLEGDIRRMHETVQGKPIEVKVPADLFKQEPKTLTASAPTTTVGRNPWVTS